ncbi:TlpA family protein disulfide reductase [Solirubrobacter sp. CPCC 204708]|uniref:TlpA family protein disulfide reductase n=1 Tax=Solirubrobacter deserti TaxID=2282478 RepID=A0ABT4RCD0_9ACTN|nr:TlpA disulfide reductase family protein [Solirubrobacter deserti]MBE2317067.1 TlpA family protein disulfide reductase [Solirubrobacter deserti]MDA0136041.1 TlpA family protein disulfide reductase [Solirubrobacter deserti]
MRKVLVLLAAVALVAVVVIGLTSASGGGDNATDPPDSLEDAREELAGAPAPLAALHEQSNQLLDGGLSAFQDRVAALKGHPIVVNKWASWCAPCRVEFPVFESIASKRGKEVAFLGINSKDQDGAARSFLSEQWLPFPSYTDPDDAIGRELKAADYAPITIFIDRNGKSVKVHYGTYRSDKQLNDDIDRYLGA